MAIQINKTKLLLVEGKDADHFYRHALVAYGIQDIQVMDFRGITELTQYIRTLKLIDKFDSVTSLAIIRDAETDSKAAHESIMGSLGKNKFSIPGQPFEFIGENPRVGYAIMPGMNDSGQLINGTLEDLCLQTVSEKISMQYVTNFIDEIQTKAYPLKHVHKSTLYSYLAVTNGMTGMKVSEAARAGAWDWEHEALSKFKKFLSEI